MIFTSSLVESSSQFGHMFRSCAAGCASIGRQKSITSSIPMALAAMHVAPLLPPEPSGGRLFSSLSLPPSSATLRHPCDDGCTEESAAPSPSQTMYRRWTWPVGPDMQEPEPVPGLRDVLSQVGLASYFHKAEAWCQQVGAAFLEECAEECEDLSLALGAPGILRCKELETALRVHVM